MIEYTKDGVKFGDEFIKLDDIIKNVNKVKIKNDSLVLLTMKWDGRRGFDGIEETITISKNNVNRFKEIICGRHINFGEIAGKHSEIYGTLDKDDITVSTNKKNINEFLVNNPSGHYCDHSFIDKFLDSAMDGCYNEDGEGSSDYVSEELYKEFMSLY